MAREKAVKEKQVGKIIPGKKALTKGTKAKGVRYGAIDGTRDGQKVPDKTKGAGGGKKGK